MKQDIYLKDLKFSMNLKEGKFTFQLEGNIPEDIEITKVISFERVKCVGVKLVSIDLDCKNQWIWDDFKKLKTNEK